MNLERVLQIINLITENIWCFRQQYFYLAQNGMRKLLQELQALISDFPERGNPDEVSAMGLGMIVEAQTSQDEILIADLLEGQMLPYFQSLVQGVQESGEVNDINYLDENMACIENAELKKLITQAKPRRNCGYKPEFTASGHITIRLEENNSEYYISGNNNPYRDALSFYTGNVSEEEYRYVIFGAGLFWEAEAILRFRPDVELVIVEEDAYLLRLALTYRKLDKILSDNRVRIEYRNYTEYIASHLDKNQNILMRKPSIRHIESSSEKDILEAFFVKSMTIKEQKGILEKNFRINIEDKKDIHCVDECKVFFAGKRVYMVAGGPSLDNSMDILRDKSDDQVIICVGTSARKLVNAGISPEFVIITDASDNMYNQIHGLLDQSKTRLLYMCSANAKAVTYYSGQKYAIFQKNFDLAEDYATKHGYSLVMTGGSVSTTALDICIGFGCKEIVCLGLDLAYTNNQTHASDTLGNKTITNHVGTQLVKSVSGEMIYTSPNLASYHRWIENRIRGIEDVHFVNVSDGAFIEGMHNLPLTPSFTGIRN